MATTLSPAINMTTLPANSTLLPQGEIELPYEWNGGLITVSYLIAVAASYSTVHLLQLRLHWVLLIPGAFTLAVAGIWSMHFVGMEALHLGLEMSFEPVLTFFSAVFPFICTVVGFAIVHWRVTSSSGRRVRQAGLDISFRANWKALRNAPHGALVISGLFIALGVCSMHYSGMAAMQTCTRAEPVWGIIALSCIIAIVAATAALYLAFVIPLSRRFVLPTALVMGVAVCGMHYTGMYGYRFYVNPNDPNYLRARRHSAEIMLAPYVVCGSLLVSMMTLAYTSLRYQMMIENAVRKFELYVPPAIVACVFDEDREAEAKEEAALGDATSAVGRKYDDRKTGRASHAMNKTVSNHNLSTRSRTDDADEAIEGVEAAISLNKLHPSVAFAGEDEHSPFARASRTRAMDFYLTEGSEIGDRTTATSSTHRNVNWLDQKMRPAFASVMFVDVVDFTTHAERMSQDELLREMNAFNGRCTRAIEDSGGVVDKYLGDAIMAVWNTVQRVPDHGARAVAAAIRCADRSSSASGKLKFEAKAGVQTGAVLMGNVGCDTKLNFTVLGDTVNQASRIEGLTRHYGARVMIGSGTRDTLAADGSGFVIRFLDEAVLKGKKKSVLLFEVMADAAAAECEAAVVSMSAQHPDDTSEENTQIPEVRALGLRRAELISAAYETLHLALRMGEWRLVLSFAGDGDDLHESTLASGSATAPPPGAMTLDAPILRRMSRVDGASSAQDVPSLLTILRNLAMAAEDEGLVSVAAPADSPEDLVGRIAPSADGGAYSAPQDVIRQLLRVDTPTQLLLERALEMRLSVAELGETVGTRATPQRGVVKFTTK